MKEGSVSLSHADTAFFGHIWPRIWHSKHGVDGLIAFMGHGCWWSRALFRLTRAISYYGTSTRTRVRFTFLVMIIIQSLSQSNTIVGIHESSRALVVLDVCSIMRIDMM